MQNFWLKLPKPFFALAPMAGVADSAFRQLCKSFGADLVYSEMVSAAGLVYDSKKTLDLLEFSKKERPYIVQLFGSKPDHFAKAAEIVEKKIKPDGLDINFGCPVDKVRKQGAGAILMKDLALAKKIIKATIDHTNLPVSLKCRVRVGQVDVLKFLKYMSGLDIKAVMIHGRSLEQGKSGEIDWQIIKQARSYFKGIVIANGGVKTAADALSLLKKTKADGVGIAQGALGRPWIFQNLKSQPASWQTDIKTKEEIFKIILKHAILVNKLKGKPGMVEMRKHLCWYVRGLPRAADLRERLVKVNNLDNLKVILR